MSDLIDQIAKTLGEKLNVDPSALKPSTDAVQNLVSGCLQELHGQQLQGSSVICGSGTSTAILRDSRSVPWYKRRHKVTVHFSNGVSPRSKTFKGKWRKVKSAMHWWAYAELSSMAVDLTLQPVQPANYLVISAHLLKEGANFQSAQS